MTQNVESKKDIESKKFELLIEMHKYNSDSGKHHEDHRQRSAHLFVIIYLFLTSVIIANSGNYLSIILSVLLIIISWHGFSLNLKHASLAMMHYWRNKQLREELSNMATGDQSYLSNIFAESLVTVEEIFNKHVGKRTAGRVIRLHYHAYWAKVHQFFLIISSISLVYFIFIALLCRIYAQCDSTKPAESLVGAAADFIKKLF